MFKKAAAGIECGVRSSLAEKDDVSCPLSLLQAHVKVVDSTRATSCLWPISRLKEKLVRLRKLIYAVRPSVVCLYSSSSRRGTSAAVMWGICHLQNAPKYVWRPGSTWTC